MKPYLYITIIAFCCLGCSFFNKQPEGTIIARVNDSYLYQKDLKDLVPNGSTAQDSTLIVNAYIDRWARQLLLMDGALQNLPEQKQQEFLKLVEQYKNDLYTKAYLERLVKKNIDTVVSTNQAQEFYNQNQESFKLNDELMQFRYLSLPLSTLDFETIKQRFKRFEAEDKRYLDSISVQFNSYAFNQETWIKYSQVTEKVPIITSVPKQQVLKNSNFLQLKDSINLYLMHIKNVRLQNQYAPLAYVIKPIKQILINQRKLELIKQLESDIINDAIKNNKFETYQ